MNNEKQNKTTFEEWSKAGVIDNTNIQKINTSIPVEEAVGGAILKMSADRKKTSTYRISNNSGLNKDQKLEAMQKLKAVQTVDHAREIAKELQLNFDKVPPYDRPTMRAVLRELFIIMDPP